MLVVSRRAGESVVIGDDVTVSVLEVRGDVVRIGIDAPSARSPSTAQELLAQLAQSNQEAASPPANAVDSLLTAIRDRAKDA